jgi:NAD(P)-dependent dehydrogenase (short-subunit alcohol dehydrogenase family)
MKRVLVTGGARRIGAAICRRLAGRGWSVVVHCHRSHAEAQSLAVEIGAEVVKADLGDPHATQSLIAMAGPLTALVNNASLFLHDTARSFDIEGFERHISVNLLAPALLARDFAAQLPAGEEGAVVHLLDNRLFAANPDHFTYALGKYGLLGMTEMQALAFAPRIRVNGVAPSITLVSGDQTEENFRRAHVNNPLGRGVAPEDVAEAVAYLLEARTVTGETIVVDAGQRLRRRGRDVAFG